ncbi:P-loop containing nucleoside triphosphate hydrolase protein [Mycena alexandri]|uniref:P-loop containing nucleoside triphosphate hydrolase protein n=1 Tax=Mycena alexandri TaxID=1745969 RepID=A0AAD6SV78_9AGAR|nr:P-loop containing nucleoside triphosphate hydrolase protein [Mycena alexandri]
MDFSGLIPPDIQVVIKSTRFPIIQTSIWTRTLAIPLYVALTSGLIFITQTLIRRHGSNDSARVQRSWKDPKRYGGITALMLNLLRFLTCSTLLGLSVASLVISGSEKEGLDSDLGLKLGICAFYLYASFLAALAIGATTKAGGTAGLHLAFILAVAFGVYFYRDIFPFATYTWPVQDSAEGSILHAKLIALTLASVVIPLITPRLYVPVDPKSPMPEPNPEQTASPLSLLLFTFLDPVIALAYKLPHLPYDLLPPLADSDSSEHLKKRSFSNIDTFSGAGSHHIFFGIIKTFRNEYATIILMLLVYVICTFASPIGINRVLAYLENGPGDSAIRPFVWILWLAFGPLTGTTALQAYYRLSMRLLVQVEGLLTELIFEHALRVRVKAHNDAETAKDTSEDSGSTDGTLNQADEQSDTSSETAQGTPSTTSKDPKQGGAARSSGSSVDVGKISNLVTTDLKNVTNMADFLLLLFYLPVSVVFSIMFLYIVLGWSAFVGLGTMMVLFPISGIAARILQTIQKGRITAADSRVRTISETMNVLRMIKLFGWEAKMLSRVNAKRDEELHWIWKREIFEWVANTVNNLIPSTTMIVTYVTYTVIMKQELRPSIVFSTMPVFDMLRNQLHMANYRMIQFVEAKVSLDRINDFLHNTELLDSFTEKEETAEFMAMEVSDNIGFRDATFTWSRDDDGSATPSKHKFTLRIDDELLFKRGRFNLVLGPTGAGKTSQVNRLLLMALLGEMHFTPALPGSWYNLPRAGGVAYAAQESWVLNETIRDNILFGSEYDEERYKKVLFQCALERDLELFEAGDKSEVGEKGLTLSGGQKARVTLARAIYSKAEILLLDDVLAALDVHTSKWIVEKCFSGDLVKGRTVILVTHNVALAAPIADFTISIGLNGRIMSQGSVADALQHDIALAEEANADLQVMEQVVDAEPVEIKTDTKADGKLILAEEVKLGRVKWSAVNLYLRGLGGFGFHAFFLGTTLAWHLAQIYETWYLGYFASMYESSPPGSVSVSHYIGIYTLIFLCDVMIHSSGDIVFAYAVLKASREIHRRLIESILGTTLRWLDVTPTSRVLTRFTQDINAVDGPILNVFAGFIYTTISMLGSFAAVVLLTPLFSIPGVFAAIIGGTLGQLFIKAQLSVKRESSNAKAPVLGHFSAAIAGLTSIRAYGAQDAFIEESLRRINKYTRAARILSLLDRWVGVRLAAVGNILSALLALYLVYFQKERANNVGFSLNMAAAFSTRILFWVRLWNDVQIQGNSLERIQQYIDIEQEKKPTEAGTPPAHWPSSGELIVEKLSASYSPDGPKVLRDISFHVKSGERVGIVGRTGSGKSSLTLALLRCIYTEGTVYYDGLPTSSINLDALRSNITIIPQMPELLSGTLRHNLDPFNQYDDAALNSALRAAGLFSLQEEMEEGRLVLDSVISSGGSNLSVGQRQILALARAIVRDSKLLILDEATSAIDYKTDSVIQTSLRNELKSDVTVITVAHRLQTILDSDKIMVLDGGRIAEFDAPRVLLKNPKGKLRALVDESGDKDNLYAMAEGKA